MSPAVHANEVPAPRPAAGPLFHPAWVVLICAVALTTLGLTILFSSTASLRADPYFFLKRQLIWLGVSVVLGWVVSRVDLEHARRYAWIIAGLALLGLLAVLIPGIGRTVNGARRWVDFGFSKIQPSEFAKLAMVFALAHYCGINQRHMASFKRGFVIPCAGIGAFAILIIAEPDFGTTALTGVVGFLMLFLAGARLLYMIPTVLAGVCVFALAVWHDPVRFGRITAFLDVEGNRSDGAYQLWQAILAFASGGLDGAGLGNGRQQMAFLPEAHTDFIFAIVGEELGLWFTFGTVVTFAVLFWAGLAHLRRAPNLFGHLLIAGSLLLLALQSIINLGVVTGSLPTKGMSMPFISYGGSNLLLMGFIIGLFFNTRRAWSRPNLAPSRALMEVSA
ncbi:MAG TPA: putative lipid II flippase FtsW [Opitutaceae bacterium]|nr:putative lipid II flippase FtsW [Opitutaceae bacterium]